MRCALKGSFSRGDRLPEFILVYQHTRTSKFKVYFRTKRFILTGYKKKRCWHHVGPYLYNKFEGIRYVVNYPTNIHFLV